MYPNLVLEGAIVSRKLWTTKTRSIRAVKIWTRRVEILQGEKICRKHRKHLLLVIAAQSNILNEHYPSGTHVMPQYNKCHAWMQINVARWISLILVMYNIGQYLQNISNMRCYINQGKPACVVLCLELLGSSALCFGTEWAPTSLRQLLAVAIGHALQAQIPSFRACWRYSQSVQKFLELVFAAGICIYPTDKMWQLTGI